MTTGLDILTSTRLDTFLTCRRKEYFAYQLGARPEPTEALRMGSAIHLGVEVFGKTNSDDKATDAIIDNYYTMIQASQNQERESSLRYEQEKCIRLFLGWLWRWSTSSPFEVVDAEMPLLTDIYNPKTGKKSRTFRYAGKVDSLIRLEDGRLALMELKTTGMSLDSDSDFWLALRLNAQISRYMIALRRMKYEVATVLYDVIRKPTINPKQVHEVDADGLKIVVDPNGQRVVKQDGKPRVSADSAKGYRFVSHIETPQEYGDRLAADIRDRPEVYFARREVPRLQSDLDEAAQELWDTADTMRTARNTGQHYRNTRSCLSPFRCPYLQVCSDGTDLRTETPDGFVRLNNIHPELGDIVNEVVQTV